MIINFLNNTGRMMYVVDEKNSLLLKVPKYTAHGMCAQYGQSFKIVKTLKEVKK